MAKRDKPFGVTDMEYFMEMFGEARRQASADAGAAVHKYRHLFKRIGEAVRGSSRKRSWWFEDKKGITVCSIDRLGDVIKTKISWKDVLAAVKRAQKSGHAPDPDNKRGEAMNTDELQRILKLTQEGHGVGMTAKFWTQLENLLKQRDAALRLADRLAEVADSEVGWEPLAFADELRAIFEEKP